MTTYEVNTYDVGQEVRSNVTFTVGGVDTDPTTITFRYLDPAGNATAWVFGVDPEVVQDAVGQYHADWTLDEEGGWYYRWEGTGTVIAAAERYFEVRESKFYP